MYPKSKTKRFFDVFRGYRNMILEGDGLTLFHTWDKVFKNGPSETCERQPYHFKFFEGCFPRISLGHFLNTLLFHKVNVSKVPIDKLDISKYVCLFFFVLSFRKYLVQEKQQKMRFKI